MAKAIYGSLRYRQKNYRYEYILWNMEHTQIPFLETPYYILCFIVDVIEIVLTTLYRIYLINIEKNV